MIRRAALFLTGVALLASGTGIPARAANLVSVCHAQNAKVTYKPQVTKAPATTYYSMYGVWPVCAGTIKPFSLAWWGSGVLACPNQNTATGTVGIWWYDNTFSNGPWYQAGTMYAQRLSARFTEGQHKGTMQGLLVAKKPHATCKGISEMTFDLTMVFTMTS